MKNHYLKPAAIMLLVCIFCFTKVEASVFPVTNTNESGPGSLRMAITNANQNPGIDSIPFNITPLASTYSILIDSALTAITESVIIDATSQPGFVKNPVVRINGKGMNGWALVTGTSVLGKVTVRGLDFINFWKTGFPTGGTYQSVVQLSAQVLTFEKNCFRNIGAPGVFGVSIAYLSSGLGSRIGNNAIGANLIFTSFSDIVYAHCGLYLIANGTTVEKNIIGYFAGDSANAAFSDAFKFSTSIYILSQSFRANENMTVKNNAIGERNSSSVTKAYGLSYIIENISGNDDLSIHKEYHYISDNTIQGCGLGGFLGVKLYNLVFLGPNNTIIDNPRTGVTITTTNYLNMIGNLIQNNQTGLKMTTLPFSNSNISRKVTIGGANKTLGNKFINNVQNLLLEAASSDNFILNNEFTNSASPAIDLLFVGGVNRNLIDGNTIKGNGSMAIQFTNGVSNNIVRNNSIEGYAAAFDITSGAQNNQFYDNFFQATGTAFSIYNGSPGNKFSRNSILSGAKGIDLNIGHPTRGPGNNAKSTASISSHIIAGNLLTLSGTGQVGDTVEVYVSISTGENALNYSGFAKIDALGNWSLALPKGPAWDPASDYYYITMATDASGNTSQMSVPYLVPQVPGVPCKCLVTSKFDIGPGTLREAINCSNTLAGKDTIRFQLPGAAPHLIEPVSALPNIQHSIFIDGSSQSGIEINGSIYGSGNTDPALYLGDPVSSNEKSTIKGLSIKYFRTAIMIDGHDAVFIDSVNILNSYTTGINIAKANDTIQIKNSTFDKNVSAIEGGTTSIATLMVIDDCLFTENGKSILLGTETNKLIVKNNLFLYTSYQGIEVNFPNDSVKLLNNIFYGYQHAVDLNQAQYVLIKGNRLGLDSMIMPMPPSWNNNSNFAALSINSQNNYLTEIDSNFIGRTTNLSIYISNSIAKLSRNYIGTDAQSNSLGNGSGIYAFGSTIFVGGTTLDSANVIGCNRTSGIYGYNTKGVIQNNYIGVNKDFKNIGNTPSGIYLWGNASKALIKNNFIGFNKENGIEAGDSVEVRNNYIGAYQDKIFANKMWGVLGHSDFLLSNNYFANNDSGAVKVTGSNGKISKNTFTGSPKAIWLNGTGNGNKQPAVFSYSILMDSLILGGSGVDSDTVEVFSSSATPETALTYLGYAVPSSGIWEITIPYDPLKNNYYVNTATNAIGNTSQLSAPFLVRVDFCDKHNLNALPKTVGICKGDSALVDAIASNVQYRWYDQNNIIANTKQAMLKKGGIYRLEVQDSFGCIAYDTITVIENSAFLNADFLMASEAGKGDDVVVVDISFAHPDSLEWNFGSATVKEEVNRWILTFPDTGNFQVTVTSHLGLCTKSATRYIHIDTLSHASPDGKVYPYLIKEASLSPNPNNGIFTVAVELAMEETITVHLYNAIGMLMQTVHTGSTAFHQSLDFDLSNLASGNYFIRVLSGKDSRLLRMIKE
jgi:hypothetical protein